MRWQRSAKLVIGDLKGAHAIDVSNLRFTFDVTRTLSPSTNKSTIKIYNLSNEHMDAIKIRQQMVYLQAGYGGALQLLSSGTIQRSEHAATPPDFETTLETRDGSIGMDYGILRRSFSAGTVRRDIVTAIIESMAPDVGAGDLTISDLDQTTPARVVFSGSSKRAMSTCARAWGLDWNVDVGLLNVTSRVGALGRKEIATVLGPTTGLLGSPVRTSSGCKVEAMLAPNVAPGGWVKIESHLVNGFFKVLAVKHSGDTFGDEWKSEIECQDINARAGLKKKKKR
jgi:hypothetical protein